MIDECVFQNGLEVGIYGTLNDLPKTGSLVWRYHITHCLFYHRGAMCLQPSGISIYLYAFSALICKSYTLNLRADFTIKN